MISAPALSKRGKKKEKKNTSCVRSKSVTGVVTDTSRNVRNRKKEKKEKTEYRLAGHRQSQTLPGT
jgi:hypothetical protein